MGLFKTASAQPWLFARGKASTRALAAGLPKYSSSTLCFGMFHGLAAS
jgi:hypothetical protein